MKKDESVNNANRLRFAHDQLKSVLLDFMPKPGTFKSDIPDVGCARRDKADVSEHRFDRPLVSLLVQGEKESMIGSGNYNIVQGQILTVCMDMPSSSRILRASPTWPLLTFFFYINPAIIRNLLCELDNVNDGAPSCQGVSVSNSDADFMEAMLRLATIMTRPGQIAVRAGLALQDLHYLLLTGSQAKMLRDVYADGRYGNHLSTAISFLKSHINCVVSASDLARAAHMSESSLYRYFKKFTGLSPLQYHKRMRLHEARKILLAEREQIAAAAYRVGYESVSQFNRDYKKLFGVSPKRSVDSL